MEEEKKAEALPSPEALIPLSKSLVEPNLASAFDIPRPIYPISTPFHIPQLPFITKSMASTDFYSSRYDGGECGRNNDGELPKIKEKQRTVWTPQLHQKFVEAVVHLGWENAVPRTITERMNVDGLTRESVASHLQKYRLYLERKGVLEKSGLKWHRTKVVYAGDSAKDRLFATTPLPHGATPAGGDGVSFLNVVRYQEEEKEAEVQEERQLIPLSQETNLASSIDIPTPINPNSTPSPNLQPPSTATLLNHQSMATTDFDSDKLNIIDGSECGGSDDDEFLKTGRRTVWTPPLHKKFAEAVAHLGLENATPSTITERMNVDGLTRERVNSHLQQYRLYLKLKGVLDNSGGKRRRKKVVYAGDSATDRLFATRPLPHGAAPAGGDEGSFQPLLLQNVIQHHQQSIAVQQQFYQLRNMRQIVNNVGFFNMAPPMVEPVSYMDDLEGRNEEGCGKTKELTLFPNGKD